MSTTIHVTSLKTGRWGVKYGGSLTWLADGLSREDAVELAKEVSDGKVEIVIHGEDGEVIRKDRTGTDPFQYPDEK
jgi:hypothetical protein